MTFKPRIPTPLFLFALTFAVPFAAGGCGKQACFFWTEAEGACPSQAEAIDFFGGQACSPIESVDSEGEFDGELCCYDVTESSSSSDIPCAGGVGGFGTGTVGVGATGTAVSSGAGGSCTSCSSSANAAFMGMFSSTLCPSSQQIMKNMTDCVCSGPCQSVCSSDLVCMGQLSSTPCFDCATDTSVGCGSQFSACVNDI